MKKTDKLIQELSEQHKKKGSLHSPITRLTFILTGCAIYMVTITLTLLSLRHDLSEKAMLSSFTLEQLIAFTVGVICIFLSLYISIPTNKHKKSLKTLLLCLLTIFTITLFLSPTHTIVLHEQLKGFHCILSFSLLFIPPVIALIFMIKKSFPTQPELTGIFAFIGIGGLGYFTLGLTCAINDTLHIAITHYAPTILSGIIGFYFGKKYLRP